MKIIGQAILIAFLILISAAHADEISKREKVQEMFKILNIEQTFTQLQAAALAQGEQFGNGLFPQGKEPSPAQKKLLDEFRNHVATLTSDVVSWRKLEPAYTNLYLSTYSEEDLDGILAFYKSRAGQAMLAKTPELVTKSQAISQGLLAELQPKMRVEIDAFAEKVAALAKAEAANP